MSKKEEVTVNEAAEKQEEKAQKENVVYLGPSIPNVVISGTVFKDGVFPEVVNEKIKEMPMLKNLFADISGMVHAVKEINRVGSSMQIIYERVKTEIKKKED